MIACVCTNRLLLLCTQYFPGATHLGHLSNNLLQLLVRQVVWLCADLAPGNIDADLGVKGLEDLLEATLAYHLSVPVVCV